MAIPVNVIKLHERDQDPDTDPRLRKLVLSLMNTNLPPEYIPVLAIGYVMRLVKRVWAQLDDTLGSSDEVEKLAGWSGTPGFLTRSMLDAGYLMDFGGVFVCVEARSLCPEWMKRRWDKLMPGTAASATRRLLARQSAESSQRVTEEIQARRSPVTGKLNSTAVDAADLTRPQPGLFGTLLPNQVAFASRREDSRDEQPSTENTIAGHRQLVDYWCEQWHKHYGDEYPFGHADARHIKNLLQRCRGMQRAQYCVRRYFETREPFFRGHPLSKLVSQLPRFSHANPAGSPAPSAATTIDADTDSSVVRITAEGAGRPAAPPHQGEGGTVGHPVPALPAEPHGLAEGISELGKGVRQGRRGR
jgi:hypothetical protein